MTFAKLFYSQTFDNCTLLYKTCCNPQCNIVTINVTIMLN